MRRADRLFQIVQHLRGGRLVTAAQLAERLEVSPRTIYRDIADLIGSGVPVEGEAGVGYVMRKGYDLPPLMFTRAEISALVAGARLIRAYGGAAMARASEEALIKIETVLPETARAEAARVPIHAIAGLTDPVLRDRLDQAEAAIGKGCLLRLDYADGTGNRTMRDVRPLGLWFWGKVWTLVWTLIAWCELRQDFRLFRIDRILAQQPGAPYRPDRTKSLAAALTALEHDSVCEALVLPHAAE
jgi:predicted DNA-binding transcriptional regulator YafY